MASVADETPAPAATPAEAPATAVAATPAPASPQPAAAPAPEPVGVATAGPQGTDEGAGNSRPRDPGGWGDAGTGDVGHGGGWGGLGGVIIRGGGIGDDDHCQIRPRPGTMGTGGRYPVGGTIYIPRAGGTGGSVNTGGGIRSRGGMSGGTSMSAPASGGRSRGGR